ncbi:YopX family protein [Ureibacillus thermosphaericus]|uniref:YopX protein domain-containing protein n=1 Tax=Ureibacillus thermosphaericus TaxID=51173 RepID=A0A840PTW9_URETH|nr:YopX family protein [Ureibacillus thermosphaericus]MBB5148201.1 hypothetical protein [Ureibacillus thermosphaericus]NKZ31110.1 hypothetical protein [Ureibacillus thermosphaericus]
MREIKFRAFNKAERKMCRVVSIDFTRFITVRFPEFEHESDDYNDQMLIEEFEPLMQFTGLKDKNGKEIYEGDIVSYFGLKYEVLFKNGAFGWMEDGEFYSFSEMTPSVFDEFEVIGNVYENPELLGGIEMNRWERMETAKKVLGRGKIW